MKNSVTYSSTAIPIYHVRITNYFLTNDMTSNFLNPPNQLMQPNCACTIEARLSGTIFARYSTNIIGMATLVMDTRSQIAKNRYNLMDAKTGILRNQSETNLFYMSIQRVKDNINSLESGESTRRAL